LGHPHEVESELQSSLTATLALLRFPLLDLLPVGGGFEKATVWVRDKSNLDFIRRTQWLAFLHPAQQDKRVSRHIALSYYVAVNGRLSPTHTLFMEVECAANVLR
jgi:hypothetical protein